MAEEPRVISFAVSGTIEPETPIVLDVEHSQFTLDGSTSPSGICIKGYSIDMLRTHDVIIRHLRFRRGDIPLLAGEDGDSLSIANDCYRIWIDHCSLSWGIDSNLDIWQAHDISVTNCIMSEALQYSVNHPEAPEAHSMALLVGYESQRVTLYNNLIAHCVARVPSIYQSGCVQIVNNITYNSLNSCTTIEDGFGNLPSDTNIQAIGNMNISGPSTNTSDDTPARCLLYVPLAWWQIYQSGNLCDRRTDDNQEQSLAVYPGSLSTFVSAPFGYMPQLTTRSALDAKAYVLANAGAFPRDAVDTRIVNDVINGTGSIIDDPSEVGGWPEL